MILDILGIFLTAGFWVATLRIAATYALAALGEMICERAGVLNLGIEGVMLLGALTGFATVYSGAGLWVGVLAAMAVGALAGLTISLFTVRMGLDQYVVGLGVTLLLAGLSPFIYRMITAGTDFSNPPSIVAFKPLAVPLLSDLPVVGEILFNQSPLVYLAFLLVPVVGYVLYRTPLGLAVRTVGENPLSAEAAGLDVYRLRIGAVTAGCALMGIAGAYLSISYFNGFLPDMVAGRGWIAIALVIFANWRPVRILLASILFAGVEALAVRIETLGLDVPYPVFLALPYVLTILVLIGVARNATYPKALAVPFRRGARA